MHKKNLLFLLVICILSPSVNAQERYKVEMVFGENDFGPMNTLLIAKYDEANKLVQFSSPPDAYKRILGNGKSFLLKIFKKVPKNGAFLTINDIESFHNMDGTDSLKGYISMPMLGISPFKGIKTNDKISGSFYSKSYGVTVKLSGLKTSLDETFTYDNFPQHIFDTTQKYLFNTSYLETTKWKKFKKRTVKLASVAIDDIDWFFGFNMSSSKLPFSHYNLMFGNPTVKKVEEEYIEYKTYNNVFFKEISNKTALLEVKSFSGGKIEMDSIISIVHSGNYQNLIIDLRDNSGGGLSPAHVLGSYLIEDEINIGYFITNKFSTGGEKITDFESLPDSKEKNTYKLQAYLLNSRGCKLVIEPGEMKFNGNVFILTNKKTASTCEPFVYGLKSNKIATTVGENTSGAMLSASNIHVIDNFYIFMAIADYYTPDKMRLDQIGVAPDIEVPSEEALDYVLKMIGDTK
jgi:hypothetical protein